MLSWKQTIKRHCCTYYYQYQYQSQIYLACASFVIKNAIGGVTWEWGANCPCDGGSSMSSSETWNNLIIIIIILFYTDFGGYLSADFGRIVLIPYRCVYMAGVRCACNKASAPPSDCWKVIKNGKCRLDSFPVHLIVSSIMAKWMGQSANAKGFMLFPIQEAYGCWKGWSPLCVSAWSHQKWHCKSMATRPWKSLNGFFPRKSGCCEWDWAYLQDSSPENNSKH